MIQLSPKIRENFTCPVCTCALTSKGWIIPGMRVLADLSCPQCGLAFYGDLPVGHGLEFPVLIEKDSKKIHALSPSHWFAVWLKDSLEHRVSSPIPIHAENFRPVLRPLLLNCLDTMYGHCLSKLVNAQFYIDNHPDFDLILLIPKSLRWLVPEGVAEVWTVDLPLSQGTQWNDDLAAQIQDRLKPYKEVWISRAFFHVHPQDFSIERFSRVKPYPLRDDEINLHNPVVTFIWREDRLWTLSLGLLARSILGRLRILDSPWFKRTLLGHQTRRVTQLAESLRVKLPTLDFAVAGLGVPVDLPSWIKDLRTYDINVRQEELWCRRYAKSQVVIGIHGSNMHLASAHAASTVELVPQGKWGNYLQDIWVNVTDVREALFRFRFVPEETSPEIVSEITASVIHEACLAMLFFKHPWNDHRATQKDENILKHRKRSIDQWRTELEQLKSIRAQAK